MPPRAAAGERAFDVFIAGALDRLSRDQEDLAGIFKRLTFLGIEIRAVHEGKADVVQVGIRGLVGALYLQDLAHKVRRGMAGVLRDGRNPGGKAYGYRPVPGRPGELAIDDEEAEIVRRIFREFTAGASSTEIVAGLNRDRVPPPRGSFWRASAIAGNLKRGYGILLNPIYVGRLVWNRTRFVKDPDTGRRVSRVNPESEWQWQDAPHLRIVDQETFEASQRLKRARAHGQIAYRKTRYLLTGLLKCGVCGAGINVKDRHRGKLPLRALAGRRLPAGLLDLPKRGFSIPAAK